MRTKDPMFRQWRVERNILPWRPRRPWLLRRSARFVRLPEDEIAIPIVLGAIIVFLPLCAFWLLSWTVSFLIIPFYALARAVGLARHQVVASRVRRPKGDVAAHRIYRFPAADVTEARRLRSDLIHRIGSGAVVLDAEEAPAKALGSGGMETRRLGKTNKDVGVIGFGAWQIGGSWGDVAESEAMQALNAAADSGVTFFDTADVYGDGRSEKLVGRLLADRSGLTVATKMGRRADQTLENYSADNFRRWNDRSRTNLGVDTIDLVQLHCPPDSVYRCDDVFDVLDTMVDEGRFAAYGVSVESCDQALAAIRRPGVATIQIILNAFRHKPLETVLPTAAQAGVGIIARVPLASGLLSGKFTAESTFADDDHRTFNRGGEAFDVGETFSGVDFRTGLTAVERLRALDSSGNLAQFALRWLLDHDAVTTVIPGARNATQARSNTTAADAPPLGPDIHAAVRAVYDELIRPQVHDRW